MMSSELVKLPAGSMVGSVRICVRVRWMEDISALEVADEVVIEESCSPCGSPTVLVRKKNGSVRFCSRLNQEGCVSPPLPLMTARPVAVSTYLCT